MNFINDPKPIPMINPFKLIIGIVVKIYIKIRVEMLDIMVINNNHFSFLCAWRIVINKGLKYIKKYNNDNKWTSFAELESLNKILSTWDGKK